MPWRQVVALKLAHDANGLPEITPNFSLPSLRKNAFAESLKRERTKSATWSFVMYKKAACNTDFSSAEPIPRYNSAILCKGPCDAVGLSSRIDKLPNISDVDPSLRSLETQASLASCFTAGSIFTSCPACRIVFKRTSGYVANVATAFAKAPNANACKGVKVGAGELAAAARALNIKIQSLSRSKQVFWMAGFTHNMMLYQKPLNKPTMPSFSKTRATSASNPSPFFVSACTFVAITSKGIVAMVLPTPAT
mmetsp:Transcript_90728/g.228171  ORF Transcript_90728/g.228171 Transcript_90728/m.228171 type:complete len:251 (+) Transcript_90728:136-888(+)